MKQPTYHLYLSPHYDDAALSCGGTIHRQVGAGQAVLVVTLCAAPPPVRAFSAYAETLHQKWGEPEDAVATRRQEDEAALAILGAEGYYLSLSDCIYRGAAPTGPWYYNSDPDIFGQVHPAELPLADTIAGAVAELIPQLEESLIYAPLGVGHHVDHQLTHKAAWQLRAQGYTVCFYEDYPYADPGYPFTTFGEGNRYNLAAALAEPRPARLRPQLYPLSEEDWQAKIKSVAAYPSQISSLFVNEAAMVTHLRNYALAIGQGTLAERFWLIEAD